MKNKKIIIGMGAVIFVLGLVLNIQYALDEYGIMQGTLHTEVLAQSGSMPSGGSSNGSSGPQPGHQDSYDIRCVKTVVHSETSNYGSSNSAGGNVSGGFGGGFWGVSGSAGGNVSNSNGGSSTTTTITTMQIDGQVLFFVLLIM